MHIKFVCFGFENIGVEYLSACLRRAGHETSLAFDPLLFDTYLLKIKLLGKKMSFKEILLEKILADDIDLLAFSSMTDNYSVAIDIARSVKKIKRNIPIIFGGMHPTAVPDKVINEPAVDFVCVGEGEEAIVELADALERGKDVANIKNIWAKVEERIYQNPPRPLRGDLDSLPFPDKEIFSIEYSGFNSDVYRIAVGRGCSLSCSFCMNSLMKNIYKGMNYKKRKRSVVNVIAELEIAKSKFPIKHVLIIDDWFTDDINWLEEFSELYKDKIGLTFACDIYPGVPNGRTIPLLEKAGCTVASLGIQTYSGELRKKILNRYDTNEEITATLKLLAKTRIFTYADFIIGIPGQDKYELLNIIDFIIEYKVDFAFFLWLRYYPKTPITQMAFINNWISKSCLLKIENGEECFSYFEAGKNYDKETAQLASFLSIALFFPKRISRWMLRTGMYRYLPKTSFFYFRIMSFFSLFIKRIFEKKNGTFYFSVRENIGFLVNYLFKIVSYKLKLALILKKNAKNQSCNSQVYKLL